MNDSPLSKPCPRCGGKAGRVVVKGGQNVRYCGRCLDRGVSSYDKCVGKGERERELRESQRDDINARDDNDSADDTGREAANPQSLF